MNTALVAVVLYFTAYGVCAAAYDLWRKYGHRQDREDSGSSARAIRDADNRAARAEPAASEPAASPSITAVAQEVIGWRSWFLLVETSPYLERDFFLMSWRGTKWEGPVLAADALPETDNEHGVYARTTEWRGSMFAMPIFDMGAIRVRGTVALTGRVLQGESGYRAERATVRELWLHSPSGPTFEMREILERRYACPVHIDETAPFPAWYQL